jgi:hypothetical protein
MLRGSAGMDAQRSEIDRQRRADLRKEDTGAHAAARGAVEAVNRKKPPVSQDKPRDLQPDEEEEGLDKGHGAALRELAQHVAEFCEPDDRVRVRDVRPADCQAAGSCA